MAGARAPQVRTGSIGWGISMSRKSAYSAVALAAFAGGMVLLGSAASAQPGDGYRNGEFREHHGQHRFGPRCFHRVSAEGFGQLNVFGGSGGGRKAQARAILHWSEQVASRFGGHVARWDAARGREVNCRRGGPIGLEMVCVASGHPCH